MENPQNRRIVSSVLAGLIFGVGTIVYFYFDVASVAVLLLMPGVIIADFIGRLTGWVAALGNGVFYFALVYIILGTWGKYRHQQSLLTK